MTDADLSTLYEAQRGAPDVAATLALCAVDDCADYGRVELDAEGRIARFEEKATGLGPGLVNVGAYACAKRLLDAIPCDQKVSLETEVFPALLETRQLQGWSFRGAFFDIGVPERLASAATHRLFAQPGANTP